jgi:tetratricopeptide (TPR) repeat protein
MQKSRFARLGLARCFAQGAIWAACAGAASAQEPATAPAVGTAETATSQPGPEFQSGLDALANGRDQEAASAFRAAFDRDKNPAALVNLGIAYTNLNRAHHAVQALQEYLSHADRSREAATVDAVHAEIARLRKSSGRIGVHLVPTHAQVELDGEPVTINQGDELLASAGRHTISAHADGFAPFSQTLDVVAGQFTLEIQLTPLSIANVATAVPTVPATEKPAATAVAAAELDNSDDGEEESGNRCALSQVCVGPVLSLFGPPNLVGGGIHARIGRYLGLGVDYQVLPTLNLNPISFGASLLSANARVYPFAGAFFLSGGVGYQAFRGQIRDGDVTISAKTSFPAVIASLGFMGKSGFVLGADLGLMFPLGTLRATVQDENGALAQSGIPQEDINAARTDAESIANKALNKLPLLVQVNLLRVGYMF